MSGSKKEGWVRDGAFGGFWLPGYKRKHWLAIIGAEIYKQNGREMPSVSNNLNGEFRSQWLENACGLVINHTILQSKGQHWGGQPNQETNDASEMVSQEFLNCSNTGRGWRIRKAGSITHTGEFGTVDYTCRNRIGSNINLKYSKLTDGILKTE
jgi:hypothetical protein